MSFISNIAGVFTKRILRFFKIQTNYFRLKPSYIIIGVQKGGTTSLFDYLSQHKQVKNPKVKEIYFFGSSFIHSLKWYFSHFPFGKNKITGEATPDYLGDELAPFRLHMHLPKAKLIVLLREPASRAFSHYKMEVNRGREGLDFDKAFFAEDARLEHLEKLVYHKPEEYRFANSRLTYKRHGLYYEQLQRWFSYFPKEQFLIIDSEEFFNETEKSFRKVEKFIGLDTDNTVTFDISNKGNYTVNHSQDLSSIKEFYKPHNEKLFSLIGKRFDW